jgi:hypothetical protein
MQRVMRSIDMLRRFGQEVGPYLLLEMLLPGGTLLTLLLFLHRRGKLNIFRGAVVDFGLCRSTIGYLRRSTTFRSEP